MSLGTFSHCIYLREKYCYVNKIITDWYLGSRSSQLMKLIGILKAAVAAEEEMEPADMAFHICF